jgi:hypothetical protein
MTESWDTIADWYAERLRRPHAGWVETDEGRSRRVCGDYLDEGFWRSTNPEGARRAGNQHRTLSRYLMALIDQGFTLDLVAEPTADQRVEAEQPRRAGPPPFLLVRARRGAGAAPAVE